MIVELVILCVTFLVAVVVAAGTWVSVTERRSVMDRQRELLDREAARAPGLAGQRVTVHTDTADATIYGLVVGDYVDRLVLVDAELVTATGTSPLPGQQFLDRDVIAWIDAFGHVARVPDHAPEPEDG